MARVFISHSSRDNEPASRIKTWLAEQGFETPFLDYDKHGGIPPGADWEKTLYREIECCEAVVIIQTPNWLESKWCFAEFTQARALGKSIFPIIETPTGDTLISPDIQALDLRLDREGGLEQLSSELTRIALDAQGGFVLDTSRPPYPGLLAFQEEDAALYFGRDDDIRRLIERLNARRAQGGTKLIALLGASGSGKSSLLRAGVIPRLKRAGRNWVVLPPMRPQMWPVDELARSLAVACGGDIDWRKLREDLNGVNLVLTLSDIANDLRIKAGANEAQILLPIDQGEELFGAADPDQAQRFFKILNVAMANDLPFIAVMALRSDYLGLLQSAEGLTTRFEEFSLGPMPLARIPQIIEGPARVAGLNIDEAFVHQAARDAQTEDALPLLAFALRELYDRAADDNYLSLNEYNALGDTKEGLTPLENAVRKAADDVLTEARPSEEELTALREAFLPAMVRVNDQGEYVRRPASWDDLPSKAHALLEKLAKARLLIVSQEGDDRTVEVAHEALLRKWPRLRAWLDDAREFLSGKQQMERDLYDWQQAAEEDKASALLHGLKLNRARGWLLERPHQLTGEERALIKASIDHAEAAEHRKVRVRRRITWCSTAAAMVLICVAIFAGITASNLDTQLNESKATNYLAGFSDTSDTPTIGEYKILRELSQSKFSIRLAFMTKLFQSPVKTKQLEKLHEYLVHAVVGINEDDRKRIMDRLIKENTPIDLAVAKLGQILAKADDPVFNKMYGGSLLHAMEKEANHYGLNDKLSLLGKTLSDFGEKLPQAQASTLALQIVAAMEKPENSDVLYSLGEALGGLGEQLPQAQVLAGALQILAAMENAETYYNVLSSLGEALGGLGETFAQEQASTLAQQIVVAMEKPENFGALSSLGEALGGLGEKLSQAHALAGAQQIVAAIEKAKLFDDLSSLDEALRGLSMKLAQAQANTLAQQILAAMEKAESSRALFFLGEALDGLGEKLSQAQALAGAQQIVVAMEKAKLFDDLSYLDEALRGLSMKLAQAQASILAQQIVAAMEKANYRALSSLGEALGGLGEQLSQAQALAGAQQILAAMEKPENSGALSSLGEALGGLGEQLSQAQALAGAQQILAAMEKPENSGALSSLGEALVGLGEKLAQAQVLAGAQQILAAMEKPENSGALSSLGEALVGMGEKLAQAHASNLAQQIVAAMEKPENSNALSYLGEALVGLVEKLAQAQASILAQQIVAAMEKANYRTLFFLGEALEGLDEKFAQAQVLAGAQQIVAAMEKPENVLASSFLGEALGGLGEKLAQVQASILAQQIVAAMEKSENSDVLCSLGEALGRLGEQLPQAQALAGAQQIVAAMEKAEKFDDLSYLGEALLGLSMKLAQTQASALAQQIVATMKNAEHSSNALSSLGEALGGLGEKLAQAQASTLAPQIVAAMKNAENSSNALSSLSKALGGLGETFAQAQVLAGAQQIVAAMQKPEDSIALSSLGEALLGLSMKLAQAQASTLAQQIVAAMEKPKNSDVLSSLGKALGGLGKKLPQAQALAGVRIILTAMKNTSDSNNMASLGKVLVGLGDKLPQAQALVGAQLIVASMEKLENPRDFTNLDEVLVTLSLTMDAAATASLLKSLVVVSDTRDKVLVKLQEKVGVKFNGDLWEAVKWLQDEGIDVKNISHFPIISKPAI